MAKREIIYRHSATVRVTHWVNALIVLVLLMSGLQIFNAHPALYLGQASDFGKPVLALEAVRTEDGAKGVTSLLGYDFNTTGVFGLGGNKAEGYQERGFPWWATLPGHRNLSMGRRWHFFFAWLVPLQWARISPLESGKRASSSRPSPSGKELKKIGTSIREHVRLKFPRGEEAKRYNILQKLAYLIVALLLLPLMLLTGLGMSPGMDTAFPFLIDMFGGRQSARTIHFVSASLVVIFVAVHLIMVLISGFWNNLRSMITGRYVIKPAGERP